MSWRVLIAVGCGVACGPSSTTPRTSGSGEVMAIVDVTVVPMDKPGQLEHQTVVVLDGKISELGPMKSISVAGIKTIDGRGKWLIPGLSDMHAHTYDPQQLALFVAMGVTSIRIMWGDPATLGTRDAIARGEKRLAPTIFTAGPIVDGNPPIWPGSRGLETVKQAIDEVAAEKAAGYDFVKVYSKLPKDIYAAIIAEGAKNGLPVMGHVPMAVGLGGVLDAHQRTVEHLDGYVGFAQQADSPLADSKDFKARLAMFKSIDPAKLADAVVRTKAAGTWNCPTLVVMDRISHLDQADKTRPELKYVSKGALAQWDPAKDFKDWVAEDFQVARDGNVWRATLVKQLSDAGAGILAGTDVGNPWLVPGYSLHQELELLVGAKLTPFQALRAATSGPAELLGAQYDQGSIKVGARADLVLLDGNPLADIRNTQKIAGVMLRGTWMPATELASIREGVAAIYAGTKSRFEGVPFDSKAAFTARYAGDTGGPTGEQRISAIPTGSTLMIIGETRFDNDGPTRWEIDAGPEGIGRSVHVKLDGLDVTMKREGTAAEITGTLGASQIKITEQIAADELIAGAPLAADSLIYRQLAKLGVGEKTSFKLAQLELRPVAIKHSALGVKRLDDATRNVGVKSISVRMFEVKVGPQKFEVAIDGDGWPVETPDFRRVE